MKAFLIGIVSVLLIGCLLVLGGMQALTAYLIRQVPAERVLMIAPDVWLEWQEVTNDRCLFQSCLTVHQLQIHPAQGDPIVLPAVSFKIPALWPPRVHVQTDLKSPVQIDATLSQFVWDIRQFNGQWGDLAWGVTGRVDGRHNDGSLTLQATGLRRFVSQFKEVPQWLLFLLQDKPQVFSMKVEQGALRFLGLPIYRFIQ